MTGEGVMKPPVPGPAVMAAFEALELALLADGRAQGWEMQTMALLWVHERQGNAFCGSLCKGDVSEPMLDMMADAVDQLGDEGGEEVGDPAPFGGVMQ